MPITGIQSLADQLKEWLHTHSEEVRWTFVYAILASILGSFFEKEGYVRFSSKLLHDAFDFVGQCVSAFIIYRLIRPRGAQDIQALVLHMFVPSSGFVTAFAYHFLTPLLLASRWWKYGRWLTLILIAIVFANFRTIAAMQGCDMGLSSRWPEYGKLIKSTDKIYNLYQFSYGRALFREVPLMPGVSLCKPFAAIPDRYDLNQEEFTQLEAKRRTGLWRKPDGSEPTLGEFFKTLPEIPPPPLDSLQAAPTSKPQQ